MGKHRRRGVPLWKLTAGARRRRRSPRRLAARPLLQLCARAALAGLGAFLLGALLALLT